MLCPPRHKHLMCLGSAMQFGPVDDAVVMLDHENRRPRGFGFVTFANEDTVDDVLNAGPLQVGSTAFRGVPRLACRGECSVLA